MLAPLPGGYLPSMFQMFSCSDTSDLYKVVVIRLQLII